MNNAGLLSTFALGLGIWKCGKPSRVYHIPTCLFLYPKLVTIYAAGIRRDMCRLTLLVNCAPLVAVEDFRTVVFFYCFLQLFDAKF